MKNKALGKIIIIAVAIVLVAEIIIAIVTTVNHSKDDKLYSEKINSDLSIGNNSELIEKSEDKESSLKYEKDDIKNASEDDLKTDENFSGIKSGYNCRYGVFLNYDGDLDRFSEYDVIVIDAQYFTKEQITEYKSKGHSVLSYINIGSLENFRDYYQEYQDLTLSDYENWDEERWIDASSERWQNFILNTLAPSLLDKGIDGFFVDNCDVYYVYPNDEMLSGVAYIMKGLKAYKKEVIINGGDTFLDAYCNKLGKWDDVITGINQETVFSKIDWDDKEHTENDLEDREYFEAYIERYGKLGAKIYLLEYTKNSDTINKIDEYCKEHNFGFYISTSIKLD